MKEGHQHAMREGHQHAISAVHLGEHVGEKGACERVVALRVRRLSLLLPSEKLLRFVIFHSERAGVRGQLAVAPAHLPN